MKSKTLELLIVAGFACVLLSGVASAAPGGALPNEFCPVTPSELSEQEIWLDHAGTRIHFCCPKCKRRFAEDPEAYALAKKAMSHDHETDHSHEHTGSGSRLLAFLGKLHPVSVHFPIALFVMAGICELAFGLTRQKALWTFGHFNLLTGWITGIAAAVLGWINAATATHTGSEVEILFQHRWAAIALLVLASIALLIRPSCAKETSTLRLMTFRAFLAGIMILTAIVGHLGGSLVFGSNYLNW